MTAKYESMYLSTLKMEPASIGNSARVILRFGNDKELYNLLNEIIDMEWDRELAVWHTDYGPHLVRNIMRRLRGRYWVDYSAMKAPRKKPNTGKKDRIQLPELDDYKKGRLAQYELFLKDLRFGESTIRVYVESLERFLRYFNDKSIDEISNNDLVIFNNSYILANNYSSSFQNQVINSVKKFFTFIESRNLSADLVMRPRRAKELPNVLSKKEVKLILESTGNLKHRAMLSLIYSCGLRAGELLSLRKEHIDSNRNLLLIKSGKGKKDRVAPLSNKTIDLLRMYYKAYRPVRYLFEGDTKGELYSARSLQMVMKQACSRVGITKPVTLHWLRHSYATHLLEAGTDVRYIQEILGHKSSRTTEIYTHVSTRNLQNIVSPFDDL